VIERSQLEESRLNEREWNAVKVEVKTTFRIWRTYNGPNSSIARSRGHRVASFCVDLTYLAKQIRVINCREAPRPRLPRRWKKPDRRHGSFVCFLLALDVCRNRLWSFETLTRAQCESLSDSFVSRRGRNRRGLAEPPTCTDAPIRVEAALINNNTNVLVPVARKRAAPVCKHVCTQSAVSSRVRCHVAPASSQQLARSSFAFVSSCCCSGSPSTTACHPCLAPELSTVVRLRRCASVWDIAALAECLARRRWLGALGLKFSAQRCRRGWDGRRLCK
jgi:hypothetical protein